MLPSSWLLIDASWPKRCARASAPHANLLTASANRHARSHFPRQLDPRPAQAARRPEPRQRRPVRASRARPAADGRPQRALSVVGHHAVMALAVQASGDPAIGLRVSRFVSPTTFHALGYALVASGSLREVFERIVRYHQVVSDALTLELSREGERYCFRLLQPVGSPAPALEAIDAFAAIYVRTCRNRLGREYAPLAVYLQRPEPADPTPWHTVFRAPVFFGAEEDRLEFAARDFDSHLDDANPELAEHNETVLKRTLAQLQPLTWERKVRAAIEAQLPEGEPSAERIAVADRPGRFDALHV
ncbi:MAG: AraC family transcriptional regulator [Pseudomonas sp.]|nr:AraC family transcriptional regulator [Pseudomonas sp.]